MSYEYLEDGVTSDITFLARGADLDELFRAAADAALNVMVNPLESIAPMVSRSVSVSADALDLLLLRFLDELIFLKDAEGLLLRAAAVRVGRRSHMRVADGTLRVDRLDSVRDALVADVKAVTLYRLRVEQTTTGWEAEVTLDV